MGRPPKDEEDKQSATLTAKVTRAQKDRANALRGETRESAWVGAIMDAAMGAEEIERGAAVRVLQEWAEANRPKRARRKPKPGSDT